MSIYLGINDFTEFLPVASLQELKNVGVYWPWRSDGAEMFSIGALHRETYDSRAP